MLRCSKCGSVKNESEFPKNKARKSGYGAYCKECSREIRREYVEANRETVNERQRERSRKDPAKKRAYYDKNRAALLARRKEYYRQNAEAILAKSARYTELHPERDAARLAVYRAVNHKQLPKVRKCKCADCGKQAQHYHHESYAPEDQLKVIPLCCSCHKKRHMSSKV